MEKSGVDDTGQEIYRNSGQKIRYPEFRRVPHVRQIAVDQTDIGKISVGDEASVSVQNMPQTVTGKVAAIETSSSSESVSKVTYTVTVSIDNSQKMLSSGAATQVIFNQNNEEN